MFSVICFSKDRPMQLDAFLASLHFFSSLHFRQISVIYTVSPGFSYDEVIAAYPQVHWIREAGFISDFRRCVEVSGDFIMLCCDDMLFRDYFTPETIIKALNARPEAFGFSLKLGANLHSLPRLTIEGELLSWNWRDAVKGEWHFPWDLSGCVYRRDLILSLLDRYHDLGSPNRLELHVALDIHDDTAVTQNLMLCFRTSKSVVLTINCVQNEFESTFDGSLATDPATLFAEYSAGNRLNWPVFSTKNYFRSHINSRDFMLVQATPMLADQQSMRNSGAMSHRVLVLKIAFWSCANIVMGFLHPLMPRRIMTLIWKFF